MTRAAWSRAWRHTRWQAVYWGVLAWLGVDLAYVVLIARQNPMIYSVVEAITLILLIVGLGTRWRRQAGVTVADTADVGGQRGSHRFAGAWRLAAKLLLIGALVGPVAFIAATSPISVWVSFPAIVGIGLLLADIYEERNGKCRT